MISARKSPVPASDGKSLARPGVPRVQRSTARTTRANKALNRPRAAADGASEAMSGSARDAQPARRQALLFLGASGALSAINSRGAWAEEVEAVSSEAVADAPVPDTAPAPAPAPAPALAVAGPTRYSDPVDKFSLDLPPGWVLAEGTIQGSQTGFGGAVGTRRTVAFFPPDRAAKDVNITVVVTNVSVEFTKLGSFGSVSAFATNLVNSLDRSFLLNAPAWARGRSNEPIQVATLVDYKEARGKYYVEYTVQKLPEPQRHLLSTVSLGSNGRYNRLYTVTAQATEEDLPAYRAALQTALDSFTTELKPQA